MMNTYKKPVVTVDAGMAEGVYAASGAGTQGTLNVTIGVWDRWGTNGGKGLAMANWSGSKRNDYFKYYLLMIQ